MTIYDEVKATGGYIDNHESDLYIEVNVLNDDILSRYPLQKSTATTFINRVTGKLCYDVPFSYIQWWAARTAAAEDDMERDRR